MDIFLSPYFFCSSWGGPDSDGKKLYRETFLIDIQKTLLAANICKVWGDSGSLSPLFTIYSWPWTAYILYYTT